MKIVYCSNAGHAKEYALLLAQELQVECLDIKNAIKKLKDKEDIVFISWIMAEMICKLKKAQKKFNVVYLAAVGAMPNTSDYYNEILSKNNVLDAKFYYLQGGVDINRLKGLKKIIIGIMASRFASATASSEEETAKNELLRDIFNSKTNYVSKENISAMLEAIKQERRFLI